MLELAHINSPEPVVAPYYIVASLKLTTYTIDINKNYKSRHYFSPPEDCFMSMHLNLTPPFTDPGPERERTVQRLLS